MSSEERNVNMLFKVMDLGLKSISTVENVIGDVLKYLNRDPDARLLKKELDHDGNLKFCVCKEEFARELSARLDRMGIPNLVSGSVSMDGACMILFSDKHEKEVEKILAQFRAEHDRGGIVPKSIINSRSGGNVLEIQHLNHYEATLMEEQAKAQGINIAIDNPSRDEFTIIFDKADRNVMNNIRMTVAVQMCSGPAMEALKKQIDYENDISMKFAKEASAYQGNTPYYLTDLDGTTMKISGDKVTFQEKGGYEAVIDADDFGRDEKVMSFVASLNCPVKLTEKEYEQFQKLSKEEQLNVLIQKDRENGRPALTQQEYDAIRKMEDARTLYEQKLAQDNPSQEVYQYSYTNNEMRMAVFEEFEQINQEAVHDKQALNNEDVEILDDARSQFRGYTVEEPKMSVEQQEFSEAVLENDFDRMEKEFGIDERWQDIIEDRNANYIPDDLEDPRLFDD